MSLLRDPALVAVDDVVIHCQANANHHRYTARTLVRSALTDLLDELAREREGAAERVVAQMRAEGLTPQVADPERESLLELGDRLKARLAEHGDALLLRERSDDERELAEAARRALAESVPDAVRPGLGQLAGDAERAAERLAAAADAAEAHAGDD